MTNSNLFKLSVLNLLVAAGIAGGCGGTKQIWISDPDEGVAPGGAGKASSLGSAGEAGMALDPETAGGSVGMEEGGEAGVSAGNGGTAADGGTAGSGDTAGNGGTGGIGGAVGTAGTAGTSGTSGNSGSGSAGKAGAAGSSGGAGVSGATSAGGSAGKAGGTSGGGGMSGAVSGAGGVGGAGKAGAGGSSAAAGAAGATVLFTPASANCASGNIDTLFTVCRNCHSAPPSGAPVPLVTYAQIFGEKGNIIDKLTSNTMPPPGSGYPINSGSKATILAWLNAGAVGVPYSNGICP